MTQCIVCNKKAEENWTDLDGIEHGLCHKHIAEFEFICANCHDPFYTDGMAVIAIEHNSEYKYKVPKKEGTFALCTRCAFKLKAKLVLQVSVTPDEIRAYLKDYSHFAELFDGYENILSN